MATKSRKTAKRSRRVPKPRRKLQRQTAGSRDVPHETAPADPGRLVPHHGSGPDDLPPERPSVDWDKIEPTKLENVPPEERKALVEGSFTGDLEELYRRNWLSIPEDKRKACVAHLRGWIPADVIKVWREHDIGTIEAPAGVFTKDPFFHLGSGMSIRNRLRDIVKDQDLPGDKNWDDYYMGALEELVKEPSADPGKVTYIETGKSEVKDLGPKERKDPEPDDLFDRLHQRGRKVVDKVEEAVDDFTPEISMKRGDWIWIAAGGLGVAIILGLWIWM